MSTVKKQVAQLSQRDRAAGWVNFGQKWKDWNAETSSSSSVYSILWP